MKSVLVFFLLISCIAFGKIGKIQNFENVYDVFVAEYDSSDFMILARFADSSGEYRYHLLWHPPHSLDTPGLALESFYELELPSDFDSLTHLRDYEGRGFNSYKNMTIRIEVGGISYLLDFKGETPGRMELRPVYNHPKGFSSSLQFVRAKPQADGWKGYRRHLLSVGQYSTDFRYESGEKFESASNIFARRFRSATCESKLN